MTVTIADEDDKSQTWAIVGEDEADAQPWQDLAYVAHGEGDVW